MLSRAVKEITKAGSQISKNATCLVVEPQNPKTPKPQFIGEKLNLYNNPYNKNNKHERRNH